MGWAKLALRVALVSLLVVFWEGDMVVVAVSGLCLGLKWGEDEDDGAIFGSDASCRMWRVV